MKKLGVFVCIVAILFSMNLLKDSNLYEKFNSGVLSYYVYVNDLKNIDCTKYEVVQNGVGAIIKTSIDNANEILISGCKVSGECVELNKDVGLSHIVEALQLDVVLTDCVNNKIVITGYTKSLPSFLTSNNKKFNIQIAETESSYLVGYPLVLHSY